MAVGQDGLEVPQDSVKFFTVHHAEDQVMIRRLSIDQPKIAYTKTERRFTSGEFFDRGRSRETEAFFQGGHGGKEPIPYGRFQLLHVPEGPWAPMERPRHLEKRLRTSSVVKEPFWEASCWAASNCFRKPGFDRTRSSI